ncbi:MAG: transposase [Pseudomonadota bacterium]
MRLAISNKRLSLTPDKKVRLSLRKPYYTGQTEVIFGPVAFLRRSAAIIPPPRQNQIRFHGIFVPHSKFNAKTKALVPTPEICKANKSNPVQADASEIMDPKQRGYRILWSALSMRVFKNNVLACPKCGGRLRLVALIKEPKALRKICEHLGFPTELPKPAPARPPPQTEIVDWA